MSHLLAESRLTLTELARRESVNPCTVWRWTLRGIRGVQLETLNIGGRRFTTHEAFVRFVEATTALARGDSPAPISRTNRQREAAIRRAEEEPAKYGI